MKGNKDRIQTVDLDPTDIFVHESCNSLVLRGYKNMDVKVLFLIIILVVVAYGTFHPDLCAEVVLDRQVRMQPKFSLLFGQM